MDIRILIVEDDEDIRETVKAYLLDVGYLVDSSPDGDEALNLIYEKSYQLVILDIMLPGVNGHEILKEFRKHQSTPVLMLTALVDYENEIRAFNNEADDYVTKPFAMQVLLKRVESLLRRSGALQKEIRVGRLTLYPESYKVKYDGTDILLTPKEFDILLLLSQNVGKIILHETLITRIWGYDTDVTEGVVHVNIKRLRDKFPVNIIRTVKGVGYCLEVCTI
jgi:two-component system response regulator VanR